MAKEQKCKVCGCTDNDCRQCIAKTGQPCYWVEPDLCSACYLGDLSKRSKNITVKTAKKKKSKK